jgi:RNase P subunit RPR2
VPDEPKAADSCRECDADLSARPAFEERSQSGKTIYVVRTCPRCRTRNRKVVKRDG